MDRRDAYREAARKNGISDHLIDRALRLARPRFELIPLGDNDAPVVGTYAGRPSLPADVEWSGWPDFFASVDCAALPPGTLDLPLPEDGTLLFFGDRRYSDDCWVGSKTRGRVVYVPAGTPTEELVPSEEDLPFEREPFPLRGLIDWNMPGGYSQAVLGDEDHKALFHRHGLDLLDDATCNELTLGGHTTPIQDDPLLPPWPDGDDEPWLLLALAHVDFAGTNERGVANWQIRRSDLVARNFGNVEFLVEWYA